MPIARLVSLELGTSIITEHGSHKVVTDAQTTISIHELRIQLPRGIGHSAFSLRNQPCEILVSVDCHLSPYCFDPSKRPTSAALTGTDVGDDWDTFDLGKSINYSALSKLLVAETIKASEGSIGNVDGIISLETLLEHLKIVCLDACPSSLIRLDIKIERPRALLFSSSVSVETSVNVAYSSKEKDGLQVEVSKETLTVRDISVDTIIGLHPHEREEVQKLEADVIVDLKSLRDASYSTPSHGFDYKSFGAAAQKV